ncbi:MAG: HAD family hydrolase [Xanthobacteraceae bacterium]
MIKAVIFDVDGTLIDSVDLHAEAWVEAFAHFGIKTDGAEVRRHIGEGADRLMPAFVPNDMLKTRGEEIDAFRSGLFKKKYLRQVRPFPGVRALFERVRSAGQTIILGSSCKADELESYKKIAGIADMVDGATTSDDADRSKPSPDIFEAALEILAPISAGETIVVGDTPYDAKAARRAGIATIGLLCGGWSELELRDAGCIAVYRDPKDLLENYDSSPLTAKADATPAA